MPSRKNVLALGLMSGTSADGVTAALCRFSNGSVQTLSFRTYPYAPKLRRRILEAASLPLSEISRLNAEVGLAFADAARAILRGRSKPAVIGSHGQTLWHGPKERPHNTFQIGDPTIIAEKTGVLTVADFRPADMAAGGQGAPLIAAFDEFLFSRMRRSGALAAQNIGGVANVSFLDQGKLIASFDTGPGNALMDLSVRLGARGLGMDTDGRFAARGQPNEAILRRMLAHPYFKQKPPKSLDKNFFGADFLRAHFGAATLKRLPDILATLSLFTARSIADAYRRFGPPKISEAIISGGGAQDPILMRDLARALGPIPLAASDSRGVPAMAKEAAAFAWLALRAAQGLPNNCPRATGARGPRVLGKIIPAPGQRRGGLL